MSTSHNSWLTLVTIPMLAIAVALLFAMSLNAVALAQDDISSPHPFYPWEIVASSERDGFYTIQPNVSINDRGTIAFVGQANPNATSAKLFVAAVDHDPRVIFETSRTRQLSPYVQINNQNQVVFRDLIAGAPPASYIRVKDADGEGAAKTIAEGGEASRPFGAPFDYVHSFPSINNHGQVVFGAYGYEGDIIATLDHSVAGELRYADYHTLATSMAVVPLIADNGHILFTSGSPIDRSIQLYEGDLNPDTHNHCHSWFSMERARQRSRHQ